MLLGVFVRAELRAAEPVIPLHLLGSRSVGIATLGMVFMSAAMFATSLFTPLFVQGVMGSSATQSGSVLAPLMLAFVLASVGMGQVLARFPRYRLIGLGGLLLAAAGQLLMVGMGADTTYPVVARNLAVIGLGLGSALAAFVLAGQNAVPIALMGVATALGAFARATGATLGSAGFGSLLAAQTADAAALTPATLTAALHETFLASVIALVIGAVCVLLLEVPPIGASAPAAARAPSGDSAAAVVGVEPHGLVPLPAYGAEDRRARRLDEFLGSSAGD